jgi:hypothetical protein
MRRAVPLVNAIGDPASTVQARVLIRAKPQHATFLWSVLGCGRFNRSEQKYFYADRDAGTRLLQKTGVIVIRLKNNLGYSLV